MYKSQDGHGEHQILDIDRHNTRMNNLLVDLASNDVAAVVQAQQFVLMQLLCTYASTIHTAVLYATTIAT